MKLLHSFFSLLALSLIFLTQYVKKVPTGICMKVLFLFVWFLLSCSSSPEEEKITPSPSTTPKTQNSSNTPPSLNNEISLQQQSQLKTSSPRKTSKKINHIIDSSHQPKQQPRTDEILFSQDKPSQQSSPPIQSPPPQFPAQDTGLAITIPDPSPSEIPQPEDSPQRTSISLGIRKTLGLPHHPKPKPSIQSQSASHSNSFTIFHNADYDEDVFIYYESNQFQMHPGECLSLKQDDFHKLAVQIGLGGFFGWMSYTACGPEAEVVCEPNNYVIEDHALFVTDKYVMLPAPPMDDSCLSIEERIPSL